MRQGVVIRLGLSAVPVHITRVTKDVSDNRLFSLKGKNI